MTMNTLYTTPVTIQKHLRMITITRNETCIQETSQIFVSMGKSIVNSVPIPTLLFIETSPWCAVII